MPSTTLAERPSLGTANQQVEDNVEEPAQQQQQPPLRKRRVQKASAKKTRKPAAAVTDENTCAHMEPSPSPEARTTRSGRLSVKPTAFWAGHRIERESDGSYAVHDQTGDVKAAWQTIDYTASFRSERDARKV